MIDNSSLLISLIFVGLFLLRAVVLDRRLPWFKPIRPEDVRAGLRRKIAPKRSNDRV
jgi:hypothetical protein